ncbi:unnamed protein product [Psylliodes chrysocephalus]|uniref:Uncharacterized protein n=1 Tax=Psylliodes chrysocephalus TaxID=3402493 RepID=A0A9P0D3Z8_9CUCU|nr:unnamed protein product [Psylliodes chrysocephala]
MDIRSLSCLQCLPSSRCEHYSIGRYPLLNQNCTTSLPVTVSTHNKQRLRVSDVYSSSSDDEETKNRKQPLIAKEHNYVQPLIAKENNYVLVAFLDKKAIKHYIGVIISVDVEDFTFSEAKRFIITKNSVNNILVRGETFYQSDIGDSKQVLKRGKILLNFRPTVIQKCIRVKPEKLLDVKKLLTKDFGVEWINREQLSFYKNLLNTEVVDKEQVVQNGCSYDSDDFCQENNSESKEPRV